MQFYACYAQEKLLLSDGYYVLQEQYEELRALRHHQEMMQSQVASLEAQRQAYLNVDLHDNVADKVKQFTGDPDTHGDLGQHAADWRREYPSDRLLHNSRPSVSKRLHRDELQDSEGQDTDFRHATG